MGKDQLDPAQVAQPTAEEDKNEVEPTDSLGVVAPVLTASPDRESRASASGRAHSRFPVYRGQ